VSLISVVPVDSVDSVDSVDPVESGESDEVLSDSVYYNYLKVWLVTISLVPTKKLLMFSGSSKIKFGSYVLSL